MLILPGTRQLCTTGALGAKTDLAITCVSRSHFTATECCRTRGLCHSGQSTSPRNRYWCQSCQEPVSCALGAKDRPCHPNNDRSATPHGQGLATASSGQECPSLTQPHQEVPETAEIRLGRGLGVHLQHCGSREDRFAQPASPSEGPEISEIRHGQGS